MDCSYCSTATIEGCMIRERSPGAIDERMISPADDPLFPKFHLVQGVEERLSETMKGLMADRPHWMT